jgi:predicted heme/steroid binding protein
VRAVQAYNAAAASGGADRFGKKFFANVPLQLQDTFHVAIVCPVLHYTMGGVAVSPKGEVLDANGPIPGLYGAGEVAGGVHGRNRLGGGYACATRASVVYHRKSWYLNLSLRLAPPLLPSNTGNSLLDCVVFGRVCGAEAAAYLLRALSSSVSVKAEQRMGIISHHLTPFKLDVVPSPQGGVSMTMQWSDAPSQALPPQPSLPPPLQAATAPPPPQASAATAPPAATRKLTLAAVAEHNTDKDCWVIIHDKVYDLSSFLPDHPGGKRAIMLFAGKDATEEFDMCACLPRLA